jgi:hypothetical protein
MKRYLGIFSMASTLALLAPSCIAASAMCIDDGGEMQVSIMIDDKGVLLDLVLTYGEDYLARFPEASGTQVNLPKLSYAFKVGKTATHEALDLSVNGKKGQMKFRRMDFPLDCEWTR